jgi:hypothetical protein
MNRCGKTVGRSPSDRGRRIEAESAAKAGLKSAYESFLSEADETRKTEAGKDLIRSIFGKDPIAEDSIR